MIWITWSVGLDDIDHWINLMNEPDVLFNFVLAPVSMSNINFTLVFRVFVFTMFFFKKNEVKFYLF